MTDKESWREDAETLRASSGADDSLVRPLATNQRIISRISDGIYRQPASALRELVANAYDADASWVAIKTDAPLFTSITVEDDGVGMSPEALMHTLGNIGGSAKRSAIGTELGVTAADTNLSPAGRPLIGKMGIGMFSVAQLTRTFQIVTKVKGDDFRTVAIVLLHQYSDSPKGDPDEPVETGRFRAWKESTSDLDAHGTSIYLTSIRPQARDTLQSRFLWDRIDAAADDDEDGGGRPAIPQYYVGRTNSAGEMVSNDLAPARRLPWTDDEGPLERFESLVEAVWKHADASRETTKLANVFDNYFQAIWDLALWLPLRYVGEDPFEVLLKHAEIPAYFLSPLLQKGKASPLGDDDSRTRALAALAQLGHDPATREDFRVSIDGLELRRPIKFVDLPKGQQVLEQPLLFVGGRNETFDGLSEDVSGGSLKFFGYLFWNPVIAPIDHRGVLLRLHNAAGTRFDSTFLGYQVSELTRLRQISGEIFVTQGLEPALNIDRESFNQAHPHSVIITKWLHSALRQLATAQKRVASEARKARHEEARSRARSRAEEIVQRARELGASEHADFRPIRIRVDGRTTAQGEWVASPAEIAAAAAVPGAATSANSKSLRTLETILDILNSYHLLDDLREDERLALFGLILEALDSDLDS